MCEHGEVAEDFFGEYDLASGGIMHVGRRAQCHEKPNCL